VTADKNRGGNEPLKTLCVLLLSVGEPSDSLLIYKAKTPSFDAACYNDIQLVCGAGIERTKAFLLNSREPEAKNLLDYLEQCISAGGFDYFTPSGYLELYREYSSSARSIHSSPRLLLVNFGDAQWCAMLATYLS
jgi:hypothetical protein